MTVRIQPSFRFLDGYWLRLCTPVAALYFIPDPAHPGLYLLGPYGYGILAVGLTEDPINPGLWVIDPVRSSLVQDPTHPGLYMIA